MDISSAGHTARALKVLYETADSLFYLSEEKKYSSPVLIKTLKNDSPEPWRLQQFYNEYEIAKDLNISGTRKVYGTDKFEGKPAVVLEYIEGQSIKELLKEKKFSLKEFLFIAERITQILHEIHEHHIIHKDLNSKNIVANVQKAEIYIIDFGISTRMNLKSEQLISPNQLEGTLAYLSPEQTGRMNRFVDYRTDFYSLGITFYEMLAGKVPFTGDDPVELVHCHIARNPDPLHLVNPEVPEMISAIIGKLLSKNAEDRYQSALGIKYDLHKCLEQLEKDGTIRDFPLASNDHSGKFQIPQKLYGRKQDIDLLLNAFEDAGNGSREMVIVSGYSGVGKTALVHEIHKPITEKRGYFIEGKFDQFLRNTPYLPFIQAFNEFVNQLLSESEEVLISWKKRIMDAVGDNGKILTGVIPNLEIIIGKQPDTHQLGASEIQNRFNYTFRNFLKSIADKRHPLVIFIDDMQWADAASLNLIRQIMTEENVEYLMLITAYRDNEVGPGHPWLITINEIRERNPGIRRILIKGLDEDHINEMVADTLSSTQDRSHDLSELIFQKTRGNPFFINEFLKTLHSNNLILWNNVLSQWTWNTEEIRSMDVTDNVVHFLADKMQKLSAPAYQMLQYASCIGSRFSANLLGETFHHSYSKVAAILYETIEEGYVMPLFVDRRLSKAFSENEVFNITYKFTHDHVQQAVYSKITEEERSRIHYRIGSYLLEQPGRAEIFQIADHLNNARDLIKGEEEMERLAHLNYEAGIKAKNNSAHETALVYFRNCISLLNEKSWTTDFDFIFNAMLETAEEEYINRREDEAEQLIDFTFKRARSGLEKAVVLEKKILLYAHLGRLQEGLEIGRQALGYLGIRLPKGNVSKKVGIGIQLFRAVRKMRRKSGEEILSLPELSSTEGKVLTSLAGYLFMTLYYTDPELFIFMALFLVNYSLKNGNSTLSPLAYVSLSIVNAAFFQKYREAYSLAQTSFDLNQKYPNGTVKGRLMLNYTGGIHHWVKPVHEVIDQLYTGYKVCMENGDLPYAVDTVNVNFSIQLFAGRNLRALIDEFSEYRSFIEQVNDHKQKQDYLMHITLVKDLMSEKENSAEVTLFDENFIKNNNNRFTLGYFYTYRALYYLLTKRIARALEYTSAAWKIIEGYKASIIQAEEVLYHALSLSANFDQAVPERKKQMMKLLHSCEVQYKKWADLSPQNFSHGLALIRAEIARIENDPRTATLYHEAIAMAHENKFVYLEAYATELLGEYFLANGLNEAAFIYLRDALNHYDRWDCLLKVRLMKEKYPRIVSAVIPSRDVSLEDSIYHASTHSSDLLDMMTVLKSSTAISGEIRIEKLLDVLMKIVLENAGAQRGYFLLVQESKYLFKSVESAEEGKIKDISTLKNELPDTIIQFVSRTKESVVLTDSSQDQRFISDEYIQKEKPKSVLCTPIISKGKLTGLLYLENNLVTGAFGPNRLELLKILSGQIAVSLENSLLYENLEQKVEERTIEIVKQKEIVELEKQKSDALLQNILPAETAEELKTKGSAQPRRYENVTVMFTDFVNFTRASEQLSAGELVEEINFYYSAFDEIVTRYGLEKIKTIGDSYMCAGGLPVQNTTHNRDMVNAALEIQQFISNANTIRITQGKTLFKCRIGIHSGPVVAGIVGIKKFAYDIWGDTVNIASKMETAGEPGKVNISGTTYEQIKDYFDCTHRGRMEAKNKGLIDMYFIEGVRQNKPEH